MAILTGKFVSVALCLVSIRPFLAAGRFPIVEVCDGCCTSQVSAAREIFLVVTNPCPKPHNRLGSLQNEALAFEILSLDESS